MGSAGLDLLQDVLQPIPAHIPVILDAKHGDLNTSTVLAQRVFTQWQVDAITLSPYPGQDLIAPFLVYPGKAVFATLHQAGRIGEAEMQVAGRVIAAITPARELAGIDRRCDRLG